MKDEILITYKSKKMFDLQKLFDKNPDLLNELCEKYPLKKECVYMIKYEREEQPKVEEPKKNDSFPKDFPPLYSSGEEITILELDGKTKTAIKIDGISLEMVKEMPVYSYFCVIVSTGELKTYTEDFLTSREV